MPDFGTPVATGVKAPDLQTLSDVMNLKQKQLDYQKSQDTYGASVAQAQANSSLAQTNASVAQQTAAPKVAQQVAQTGLDQFKLSGAQAQQATQLASGLIGDPDFVKGNSDAMVDKLNNAQDTMTKQFGIDPKIADATITTLKYQALHNPQQVRQSLINMTQPAQAQAPTISFVPTQGGTQPYNTNPLSTGGVGPQGTPMVPPNQTIATTGGGTAVGNTTTGTVAPFRPQASGPQVDFPSGENGATQAELQLQRTSAQQAANQAPTMHNINRSIIGLVDTGDVSSGKWGEAMQKLRSATGFLSDKVGDPNATDTNLAGKMLERSALTAAQAMGPHTNAGLEAQVRANGSLEYTPQALRKIAALNDSLTTGSTMYQAGLENAISGQGGSVFAKRQFDQQWAGAMNPSSGVDGVQALRFKNAIDNGDQVEQANILKEVGGKGSKGATALLGKLRSLQQLSGQQ